jgi:hypothetical protein
MFGDKNGALERIRTSDHLIRSQVLYPAELRVHKLALTERCNVVRKVAQNQGSMWKNPFFLQNRYAKFAV